MKIPDKWDQFSGVSALMEKTKHVRVYPSYSNRFGVGVDVDVDVDHYVAVTYWQHLLNKYKPKISDIVNNIKGSHE